MSVRRPGPGASEDDVLDWESERRQSLVDEDQADHGECEHGPAPHEGHFSRIGGTWWCDTCDSPYCCLA